MKRSIFFLLLVLTVSGSLWGQSGKYSPYVALEFNMGVPLQMMRAAPVNLGDGQKGFILLFSEERNLDPYEENIFFPKHSPKLALVDTNGKEVWRRELPSAMPGIWFVPVLPFDLDGDGVDEIYYVNNINPERPFAYSAYKLERLDSRTGELTGQWDWTAPYHNQANSYKWRFFLVGGYVHGQPVLVTAQGTYRDMKLQAWNKGMEPRWKIHYPDDFNGPRGSHSTPVLDIGADGVDEFMYGERCTSFDTGEELFALDGDVWYDHSDVVLPVYDKATGTWDFFTAREKGDDGKLPRAVMFNQQGEHLWAIKEMKGHFHYGWVGNLGPNGERIAMTGRYNLVKGGDPERWTFEAKTGREITVPFPVGDKSDKSSPVDFNGDGIHEILISQELYDNQGNLIHHFGEGATTVTMTKILDLDGEQLMFFYPDGTVRIWADRNAKDTPEMKKRFAEKHYRENVRHSAVGYNSRFPILNY